MSTRIADLLRRTAHRLSPLPNGRWSYYQEWNDAVFLHYRIPAGDIKGLLPTGLELDTINGEAWVSIVGFTMQRARPRLLPSWPVISDFPEVNVRTYVKRNGLSGVYFFRIAAAKQVSVSVARTLSVLPYRKAEITRMANNGSHVLHARMENMDIHVSYAHGRGIPSSSALDRWLVERYALFQDQGDKLWVYEIHHDPWPLSKIDLKEVNARVRFGKHTIVTAPDLSHYSSGVRVLSWPASER